MTRLPCCHATRRKDGSTVFYAHQTTRQRIQPIISSLTLAAPDLLRERLYFAISGSTNIVSELNSAKLLACPDCDALFTVPPVRERERVVCPQCGAELLSRQPNAVHRATAFTVSAAFFFLVANLFPFLTLQSEYRASNMRLVGSVSGLENQGDPLLAALVGLFTLVAPALLISALLYVLVPMLRGGRLPGAVLVCRAIHETGRWNMVEVFLLGVIVSLLKLGSLATLTLGISFWAFVGLILCLASAVTVIDRQELWMRLEETQP